MTAPKPCEDGTVSTTTGQKKCEVCPTGAFCTHSGQVSIFTTDSDIDVSVVRLIRNRYEITQLKEINYGGCEPLHFYCPQGSTVLKTYEGIKFFKIIIKSNNNY